MANEYKINAWLVASESGGVELRWKYFPLDGMNDWSTNEANGQYVAAGPNSGWYWRTLATDKAVENFFLTAPLPVVCSDDLELLRPDRPDSLTINRVGDPSMPQPEVHVWDQWPHQRGAYWWIREQKPTAGFTKYVGGLGMGMGSGKTKVAIDTVINLPGHDPLVPFHPSEMVSRVPPVALVLCPASVLGTWRGAIPTHAAGSKILIVDSDVGDFRDKSKAIDDFLSWRIRNPNAATSWWVVINYETARMPTMVSLLGRKSWTAIILDESHRAKSPTGATFKLIKAIRSTAPCRLCLSGTPMSHSPLDLFSQTFFLSPSVFGSSITAFRAKYTVRGRHRSQVVGWRNRRELSRRINSIWYFCGSDVLDLPPITITDRTFVLSRSAKKIYGDLWRDFVAHISPTDTVIAANALVKLLRCQQAACGFAVVADLDGVERTVKIDDSREKLLGELLGDIDPAEKVVVFCRFREDLAAVRRQVEMREWELNGVKPGDEEARDAMKAAGDWKRYACGEVSGSRKDLTPSATLSPEYDVFAVQIFAGGVGVDFTAAAIAIMYSVDFSLGNYDQMLCREHRPGQTKPVRVVRLVATGTVDDTIYNAIRDRREVNAAILELAIREKE